LVTKGHTVVLQDMEHMSDIILSKRAWNWNHAMWDYLEVALKQARKEQRLKHPKATVVKTKKIRKKNG